MATEFSTLEKNILLAKGLTVQQIAALGEAGIASRADLITAGDPATLGELVPGIAPEAAEKVMQWATGQAAPARTAASPAATPILVDSGDVVYCAHCSAKQPKDYKSGDLCIACGKQAEPILACYWCAASGPGKFCRSCGARFVPTAELDLALLLRRDGLAKDDIPHRLEAMSPADKDLLWGRVRRQRS